MSFLKDQRCVVRLADSTNFAFLDMTLNYSELTVIWGDLRGNRWTSLSCKKIAKA